MVQQIDARQDPAADEAAIQRFQASFRGQLVRPGDAGYDAARAVYNGMIDRRPALIARCAGVADVIQAVSFARANDLLVAVRGGGHNVAGNAICDDGLVIDLSAIKGMRVDPGKRTARAEAGLTWGEFDRETQAFGLATTGGVVSSTGIAGLTLGGGVGWLMRSRGLVCDNLQAVDLVTAEGQLVTASAAENADLFWGVRGGGGNFGIVTSFEYRLHQVGPVLGGMVLYPVARATDFLRFYREFALQCPDELTVYAALMMLPDAGPVVAAVLCYSGPINKGEDALQPLRAFGPPLADMVRPMTYPDVQSMMDAAFPFGFRNYWKASFLSGLPDDAVDTVAASFAAVPSPLSLVLLEPVGGAMARVDKDATAFAHRDAAFDFVIMARWSDPADSDRQIRWARELWSAMQPHSTGGVYVNALGEEGDERVQAAYGAATYERLVRLKNRYDPTNVFRLNQNIRPTVRV